MNKFNLIKNIILLILRILYFILLIPLIGIIYILDAPVANRITKNRFTFKDTVIHIIPVIFCLIILILLKKKIFVINLEKLENIMALIINLLGVFFAISFAITTFILSFFQDKLKRISEPIRKNNINDIIDDLRFANKIIFFVLLIFILTWFLFLIKLININNLFFVILISLLLWTIIILYKIVKNIFYIIKIE